MGFPERWRVQFGDHAKILFRALHIQPHSSRVGTGQTGREIPKIAVSRHRTGAVLRASIHVIPLVISICEVVTNWYGSLVGSVYFGNAWLQFASQIHSLMMHASLTTIFLTYMRHEVTREKGLPYGGLFAGLQLTSISYLWSLAFRGSLAARMPPGKKFQFFFMVVLFFTVAIVSNPSSAILMMPSEVRYYRRISCNGEAALHADC